jgi:hypothetical protein
VFNVDVARLSSARDVGETEASEGGEAAKRHARLTLGFGAGAVVLTLLAAAFPGRLTLVGAILFIVLFVGRRALRRAVRFLVFAVMPYQMIWTLFLGARGLAEEVPWVDAVRLWPRELDVWLFGGELPTTALQRLLFDPDRLMPYDYFFTALHVSFFFVPFVVGMLLNWQVPAMGRRFLVALALLLAMGLPGFIVLPGNPPWMDPATGDPNPVAAHRVNAFVAQSLGIDGFEPDGTLKVEENSMAVLPSIHMGVSFLLALAAPAGRQRWRLLTGLYAAMMAFSLVYLGEHQVVDEVFGIGLAILAWRLAPLLIGWSGARLAPVAGLAAGGWKRIAGRLRPGTVEGAAASGRVG